MITLAFFVLASILNSFSFYESQIAPEIKPYMRKFKPQVIGEMLKHTYKSPKCNIKVSVGDTTFAIFDMNKDGSVKKRFGYTQLIDYGGSREDPDLNEYNCMLTPDKKILQCGAAMLGTKNNDFSGLRMHLDQHGNIIRLQAKVVRQVSLFLGLYTYDEVLSDVDCEIDYSEYETPDPFDSIDSKDVRVNNSDRSIVPDKSPTHEPPPFKEGALKVQRQ